MGKTKSKKHKKKAAKPKVWVCRGCCCGTRKKHPGVDHDRLLRLTRDGAEAGGVKVAITDCLGPCGQGNIIVARVGGKIRWLRNMNGEDVTADLATHLAEGRRLSDLPPSLAQRVMRKRNGDKPKG